MAIMNAAECSAKELYHLMIQTIIPRPIAWVLTRNGNDSLNLAPFSYFNGISSDPPLLMISVGKKSEEHKKDTWANIEERDVFVVHVGGVESREQIAQSAQPLEYGVSEVESLNMKTVDVDGWSLPRLDVCKVAFLCRRHQIIEIGNKPQALIIGEIQSAWLDDAIVQQNDKHILIDEHLINPLARLGKDLYGSVNILP